MATVTEMRAWLRANTGEDIPARGRLDARLIQMYEDAHAYGPTIADIPDDPDWDLDGGDMLADADEPPVQMQPERPPRTARSARQARRSQPVGQRTSRLLNAVRGTDKGKSAGGKKKVPRTSLEKFTTRAYTSLGRMMGALSPATGNCLQAQAAMAGVILEDTVRGTFVDRFLQPAARAEDKLDKIGALVLPPVVVFALEQNEVAVVTGAKTPQAGAVRRAVLMPVLRESLRIGLEVSEAYADQIKARLEKNAETEAEIDKLIALIFGQPTATAEDVPEPEMAGTAA